MRRGRLGSGCIDMDSNYIQSIRSKLQKRLKRLAAANQESFRVVLAQTWLFLQDNQITKGILDDLERRIPEAEKWADTVIQDGRAMYGDTELTQMAICYWIVKNCATAPFDEEGALQEGRHREITRLTSGNDFRESYVESLFDYIEEQVDDKRMVLALLKKYKHRCEWFRKKELLSLSEQGETSLVYDLYEYLHDQGIEFHIEPKSASGRADLISLQSGKDRLLADAKIFNPEGSQDATRLIEGFRQVYEYTKDFNEPFGYLVIFKTCERDLAIPTENQESAIPFISHNNKTIFFVVIDIFLYEKTASERGKLKAYEISPARFVESLSETSAAPN